MTIGAPWVGTVVDGNVAGTSATSVTVDVSGATNGEVVWIIGTIGDAEVGAIATPSGWNLLGQQSEGTSGGSSSRTVIFWKVKQAGDGNVTISDATNWTVSAKRQFVPISWPGVDTVTPAESLAWDTSHTSGSSYTTPSASPTAATRWAVGVFSSRGSTASVAWTADAALTARASVIHTSSIFVGLLVADSNGTVTNTAHSYASTGQSASHGLGAILYLIPAAPVVAAVASNHSNTAGYQVNVPTGTANGDLLVGVVASDFGTLAGNALGTGWTALTTSQYDAGTNAFHIGLWARVANSEPASYTVSLDSSDSVGAILRITGWDSASGLAGAIAQVAPSTTGTGTTAPSISPFGPDDLLLTFHGGENSAGGARTWTPPTGMTEDIDVQSTTWTTLEVNHLGHPSTPSGTKVATPSAAIDIGAACSIVVKVAGVAAVATPPLLMMPGLTWRRQFKHAQTLPAAPLSTVNNFTQALNAGLSFTSSANTRTSSNQSASVGFTSSQARAIRTGLATAVLSFTSAQTRGVGKGLSAGVSFTSSMTTAVVHFFTQSFSAGLSFTSSQARAVRTNLSGGLSFTSSQARRVSKGISAGLSFTSSQTRAIRTNLSGGLSFTSAQTRRIAKSAFAAGLSFTSSMTTAAVHFFSQSFTAGLSFTSSQTRRVGKGVAAGVSFTSSQARAIRTGLSGGLSFTSSQARAIRTTLSGGVSFTSSQIRAIRTKLTGGVSFTGSLATQAVHFFTQSLSAGLSFTGSLTTRRTIAKALSASVGFTSSMTRRTATSLAANLSFTGTQTKRIATHLAGSVSFTGLLDRVSSAIPTIGTASAANFVVPSSSAANSGIPGAFAADFTVPGASPGSTS